MEKRIESKARSYCDWLSCTCERLLLFAMFLIPHVQQAATTAICLPFAAQIFQALSSYLHFYSITLVVVHTCTVHEAVYIGNAATHSLPRSTTSTVPFSTEVTFRAQFVQRPVQVHLVCRIFSYLDAAQHKNEKSLRIGSTRKEMGSGLQVTLDY